MHLWCGVGWVTIETDVEVLLTRVLPMRSTSAGLVEPRLIHEWPWNTLLLCDESAQEKNPSVLGVTPSKHYTYTFCCADYLCHNSVILGHSWISRGSTRDADVLFTSAILLSAGPMSTLMVTHPTPPHSNAVLLILTEILRLVGVQFPKSHESGWVVSAALWHEACRMRRLTQYGDGGWFRNDFTLIYVVIDKLRWFVKISNKCAQLCTMPYLLHI